MTQPRTTIEKARKVLGEKFSRMTDEQIESILRFLYSLSERAIDKSIKK